MTRIAKIKMTTKGTDMWWNKKIVKTKEEVLQRLINYFEAVLKDMKAGIDVSK
ncbi:hypothetical protein LCGC14_0371690 [marine sediment metagenome]|uniref:Uncharacterized protein n=1 Tax=marine sediment metagenome TaxID=412755 RepID=A0A0F9TN17_9ZZZZ